jgi:pimeloyl-ACP methyl ester carboxylesterase
VPARARGLQQKPPLRQLSDAVDITARVRAVWVPGDGRYSVGALVADVVALHQALSGDDQAVLVGHDWGAEAAYGAAAFVPDRWRRLVTLAVPPFAQDPVPFSDYERLKPVPQQ